MERQFKKNNDISEEVRIPASGGGTITADLRSCAPHDPLPLVIVSHGFLGYRRWGFFPYVSSRIAISGFHVLTFDFSHNGTDAATGMITRKEEFATNTVSMEKADLEAVCRFAVSGRLPFETEAGRIGLLGHSRGGAVSLLVSPMFSEIRSLVTWSSPSNLDRYSARRKSEWKRTGRLRFNETRADGELWLDYSYYEDILKHGEQYDIPGRASELKIPYLIIHGRQDAAVTLPEAKKLIGDPRPGRIKMEIIEGCGHTFGVRDGSGPPVTKGLNEALTHTIDWFRKTV
ncbi:MAG: alpha/beta fold hydrolase [Candidatus Krumholzibacteriota bacterium]|nr:alpha/beta fold hydrolase [Candidatus Krumholzibacteriota bacterium]